MAPKASVQTILTEYKEYFKENNFVLPKKEDGEIVHLDDLFGNQLFQNLMANAPSIILIFNFATAQYEYFSSNLEKILGYIPEKLTGISGAEFVLNCFGPVELPIIGDLNSTVIRYYKDYAALQKVDELRLTHVCKLRKFNGDYIWTLIQTVVLEVLDNGIPLRTIAFVTDISDIKTDNKISFNVSVKSSDGIGYETIFSKHYESEILAELLTKREIDVLNLLCKGCKNTEISEKLGISIDTVKTHRKNILRKTGKTNFIQLLN